MPANNRWPDEFFGFLVHELLAVVLCWFVTLIIAVIVGGLVTPLHLSAFVSVPLFGSLFSPLYWGAAVAVGFLFNKRMRRHSACWAWVLPVLGFGFVLMRDVIPKIEYYGYATAWKLAYEQLLICQGECLGAMFFTVPTINSIAYSIGAWLALRPREGPRAANTSD